MNNLIYSFNECQAINKELKIEPINLPQIVVIGSQSSGKSSVLESIIGCDIFPKGKGMITRSPLRLKLVNGVCNKEIEAKFEHSQTIFSSCIEILNEIKKETDRRTSNTKSITEEELVLTIFSQKFPTLTLVDLPGLIQNIEKDQPKDLENQIQKLTRQYIEPDNSIILAISPANIDLATSEIVKYAKEVDPQGQRTIHVLTKLDIINAGENVNDSLNCEHLRPSLAVIGVINRSEKDNQMKLPVDDQRDKESKFFKEKYPELKDKNGTIYLQNTLEKILTQSIKRNIPVFEKTVTRNIQIYENELRKQKPVNKKSIIASFMNDFCNMYKRTLEGNLSNYDNGLEGGALISVCLYETFNKTLHDVTVADLSNENINNTIKNSKGVKDVSFSFEKPFNILIRDEIAKFKDPSEKVVNEVEEKLNEFVEKILEKLLLSQHPKLMEAIRDIALKIINKRSTECRVKIKDYIFSEINDVTFTNPYKDILANIKNFPVASREEDKDSIITTGIIKFMINMIGLTQPMTSYYPHISLGLVATGFLLKVKEAYDSGNNKGVLDIINNIITAIGLETIKIELNTNLSTNLESFMNELKKNTKIESNDETINQIQLTQVIIIKNVITLYFEMVQKNIINYVPKTIQAFLINEISEIMRQKMQIKLMSRDDFENLIFDDGSVKTIENLKNDLEKLSDLKEKLRTLRSRIAI